MTLPVWTPERVTPAQWRAAHFLAERLRDRFNPRRHASIWTPSLSHDLQTAWDALAREDFALYQQVHPTASEVQALTNALLTNKGRRGTRIPRRQA